MARKGTDYKALLQRISFADDGLPAREVGEWTLHKLALLEYYLRPFAKVCTGGWYFLDGFAGNGANRAAGFPLAKGSALIGVGQSPRPLRAVLIERDLADSATLRSRCASVMDIATVIQGDCNDVIAEALREFEDTSAPAFCFLDP